MAVAWIPLRSSIANTDVALVLVATIAVVARLGGRAATVLGAISAALAFDYFHTRPFDNWDISHPRDIETTVLIVLVGVLVGELTIRVFQHRAAADRGSRDLALMAETAELMAVGDDPGLVVAAVGGELTRLLGLIGCEFSAEPPSGAVAWIERDGTVAGPAGAAADADMGRLLDLPVWVQGQVLGHYRLEIPGRSAPAADRLALAVSLADQAGAALAVAPPTPPWYPNSEPRLRVVRTDGTPGSQSPPPGPGNRPAVDARAS